MFEPMEEDFSTIEHDFLHTKDYFSNCKFVYKERMSKLDFFQNIGGPAGQETAEMLSEAKAQLVAVKQEYSKMDAEIRVISQEIYDCELLVAEKKAILESLEAEEKALDEECCRAEALCEQLIVTDSLNRELDHIEGEIRQCCELLEKSKSSLANDALALLRDEEEALKRTRQELLGKQRRLTVINTESYIDEIYSWYQEALNLLCGIFGSLDVQVSSKGLTFKVGFRDATLETAFEGRKIVSAILTGNPTTGILERFDLAKEYCLRTNNAMLLIARTFFIEE